MRDVGARRGDDWLDRKAGIGERREPRWSERPAREDGSDENLVAAAALARCHEADDAFKPAKLPGREDVDDGQTLGTVPGHDLARWQEVSNRGAGARRCVAVVLLIAHPNG